MLYKEYRPAPALQHWVESYWKFVTPPNPEAPVTPFEHVYPPEAACSLLFVTVPAIGFSSIFFAGPSTKVREVTVFPDSINVGVRLKPGFSACLNTTDPKAILNTSIPIHEAPEWQLNFLNSLSVDFDAPHLLDDLLIQNCIPVNVTPDERVIKAVDLIIKHAGDISITQLSDHCFLGERQLQRLFARWTGVGVKQFCQIRRLRSALIDLYVQRRPWPQMVVERGFADQAHFYKSFRNVAAYKLDNFLNHIDRIEHQLL